MYCAQKTRLIIWSLFENLKNIRMIMNSSSSGGKHHPNLSYLARGCHDLFDYWRRNHGYIGKIEDWKACGIVGIPSEVVKALHPQSPVVLITRCRKFIDSRTVTTVWKQTTIIPILKGTDKNPAIDRQLTESRLLKILRLPRHY